MRVAISSVSPHNYLINGESFCTITEKDLSVVIDQNLISFIYKQLQLLLKLIVFLDLSANVLSTLLLCHCYIRPILEYANAIWGPYYISDHKLLERGQRRATKLVPSVKKLPYAECSLHLQLPSLSDRRK